MANTRREIAQELIALERRIAPTVAEIEVLKEKLRAEAITAGAGFTEEIDGDSVKVTAASESKLKGIMPVLKPEAFLKLAEQRREKLIADGVITMQQQWTDARKPSVKVELASAQPAQKRKR